MRLVDADNLVNDIIGRCGCVPYVESRNGEAIYLNNLINEQPTAYDVDKVVERLEEMRDISTHNIALNSQENDIDAEILREISHYRRIIQIVKSGYPPRPLPGTRKDNNTISAHAPLFPAAAGHSQGKPDPVQTVYPAAAGNGLRDSPCRSSWVCLPDQGDR